MSTLFEGLTESEIEYLQYLNEHHYFDGLEMMLNMDSSSDYRTKKLETNGYIILDSTEARPGTLNITLTDKGISAIMDYQKYQKRIQPLISQINALNQISSSLKEQVAISTRQADSANEIAEASKIQAELAIKKARKADIKGIISLIISIFVACIDFIVNYDRIITFIEKFFNL